MWGVLCSWQVGGWRTGPFVVWCVKVGPGPASFLFSGSRPPVPGGRLLGTPGDTVRAPALAFWHWWDPEGVLNLLLPFLGPPLPLLGGDFSLSLDTFPIVNRTVVHRVMAGERSHAGIYRAA